MGTEHGTEQKEAAAATGVPRPARAPTALLTCAMAFSMMQLFLLGALGPRLVDELDVSPTLLGLTTTVGFGAAAVLSPVGGRVVDRVGPRRCLVALLLVSAVALALIGSAPGAGLLLAAVALGGLPQALANPATNKAILATVPPERRGSVTGMKQSGVQLGAFAAGLPLAALAGVAGWRGAVWTAAGAAVVAAAWAARALPRDPRAAAQGWAAGALITRTAGCDRLARGVLAAARLRDRLGQDVSRAVRHTATRPRPHGRRCACRRPGGRGRRGPGRLVEGGRAARACRMA
ncbi:MFS transporter, partial [Streptomyces lunaelactis]|uniref:MFS transporter n=1 Tax=Streptomyces lunaelactis TaxID=1535768 RepID=UPI002816009A